MNAPLDLVVGSYSVVDAFAIISLQCSRARSLTKGKIHLIMEQLIRPAIFLLSDALQPEKGKEWRSRYELSAFELSCLRESVRCLTSVIVRFTKSLAPSRPSRC